MTQTQKETKKEMTTHEVLDALMEVIRERDRKHTKYLQDEINHNRKMLGWQPIDWEDRK